MTLGVQPPALATACLNLNYFFPPSQWYLIFTYLLLLVYLPHGSICCTLYLNMALWISHLPITASSTGKCTHAHSHSGQSRSSSISVWSNVCRMCQDKTQPPRPRLATHRSHWPDASISSTRTHKLVWLSFFFQLKHLRRFGCFQGKADRDEHNHHFTILSNVAEGQWDFTKFTSCDTKLYKKYSLCTPHPWM